MKAFFITVFLTLGHAVFAQESTYRNLVFEGAGIRGIAYAGVIRQLEIRRMMPQIKKVGGTSAGAITALMVSLGYQSQEIYRLIGETEFGDFNDGRYFFIGGFRRLSKKYGWYRGEKFQHWLDAVIKVKTGDENITFRQLRDRGFRELYVTGTSLNRQRTLIFSAVTYPDMRVSDAVRISMSVPLYFEAKYIDAKGAIVPKPQNTDSLDLVVDGGITANFPIWLFDGEKMDSLNRKTRMPDYETLGIRIDTDEQTREDAGNRKLSPVAIRDLRSYVSAFYAYVLENLNRNQLTDEDWKRTISVSSKNIGPKVKRLSETEKQTLMQSGEEGTERFLKQKKG